MFVAKNHQQFNEAFNNVAGTNNIAYAEPWHISVTSGRTYMQDNRAHVGRKLASAMLDNHVIAGHGKMAMSHVVSDPSPQQKAALHAVARSKTDQEFEQALKMAVAHRALSNAAIVALRRPSAVNAYRIPRIEAEPAAVAEQAMEVDTNAPAALAAPASPSAMAVAVAAAATSPSAAASPLRVKTVLPQGRGASKVAPRRKK